MTGAVSSRGRCRCSIRSEPRASSECARRTWRFRRPPVMRAMVGGKDERMYIVWFQEPGQRGERDGFEGAVDFRSPDARAAVTGRIRETHDGERRAGYESVQANRGVETRNCDDSYRRRTRHLCACYEKSGFRGGINWYRNIDRNLRDHPEIGAAKLELPCLMITAEWDGALPPRMAAGMPRFARISKCTISSARGIGCSRSFRMR